MKAAVTAAIIVLVTAVAAVGLAARGASAGGPALARPLAVAGVLGTGAALAAADLPATGGRTWSMGRLWHPGFRGDAHGPVPCSRVSAFDTADSVSAAYTVTSRGSEWAEDDVVRSSGADGARAAVAAWGADLRRCMTLRAFPARQGDVWLGRLTGTTAGGATVWSWVQGARNDLAPRSVTVAFAVRRDAVSGFVAVTTDARGAAPITAGALGGTIAAASRRLASAA